VIAAVCFLVFFSFVAFAAGGISAASTRVSVGRLWTDETEVFLLRGACFQVCVLGDRGVHFSDFDVSALSGRSSSYMRESIARPCYHLAA
jgi:hypothetical protein